MCKEARAQANESEPPRIVIHIAWTSNEKKRKTQSSYLKKLTIWSNTSKITRGGFQFLISLRFGRINYSIERQISDRWKWEEKGIFQVFTSRLALGLQQHAAALLCAGTASGLLGATEVTGHLAHEIIEQLLDVDRVLRRGLGSRV